MTVPVQPEATGESVTGQTLTPDQQFEIMQKAFLDQRGVGESADGGQDEMTDIKRMVIKQEFTNRFKSAQSEVKEQLPNMTDEQFAGFMQAVSVEGNLGDAAKILIEATRKNDEVQSSHDDKADKNLSVEGNPTGGNRSTGNPPADIYEATDRIKAKFR
jgi:hypothetical protein